MDCIHRKNISGFRLAILLSSVVWLLQAASAHLNTRDHLRFSTDMECAGTADN